MIRTAEATDWTEVASKITAFNEEYFGIPLNYDRLFDWYTHHMNQGVVYLSEQGIISALMIDDPVRNWRVLAETAWYDPGKSGIRLLRKLIEFGAQSDADELRMTTLNTTPAGVIGLLERMGFEEIERSHRLAL